MNSSSPQRYCSSCGALLALESRFCNQCGAPIEAIPPTQKAEAPLSADQAPAPSASAPQPPPQQPKKSNRAPLILAILFGGLACCCICVALAWWGYRYFTDQDDEPTPLAEQATDTPAPAPLESEPPPATALPTEPPAPPSPTTPPGNEASYQNVRFYYDPLIAREVVAETVPESNYADAPPFDLYPEHVRFAFNGYPLYPGTFHTPQILVFPAPAYAALNPSAADEIASLQNLLALKPPTPPDDRLPFLPIWNAAQLMQANMRYLDFQTGSGVRFVTQFGQDVYPINNQATFYTFQGLSADGLYFISALLPVSNPSLPNESTVIVDDAFYENFATYVQEMETLLSAQPDASFTPNLSLLDAMIQSISVR